MSALVALLLLAAVVCFALAAAGVPTGRLNLLGLGLALFALAFLIPAVQAAGVRFS